MQYPLDSEAMLRELDEFFKAATLSGSDDDDEQQQQQQQQRDDRDSKTSDDDQAILQDDVLEILASFATNVGKDLCAT